ncbi:uncharacterized protein NEMAJ01_1536 [Nematocida major]|uniref:uncharacterized protein n=1 Tax=Nematocida major TaxID=1912982 RepID=UPI00200735E0|nr:uncharacterized protein NEMAJ01_1536 [Nematocida major]KAH9386640.1 hypothetical protein NEMAJ01_1536 [Nematocida major]
MSIVIKIPKTMRKESITVVKYRDGRLFLKTGAASYQVTELPLDTPKYIINSEGAKIVKVTNKGLIRRSIK